MIIRTVREADIDEMYANFMVAQVSRANAETKRQGFFEYKLDYAEFRKRALQGLSVLMQSQGKILAHVMAYPVSFAREHKGDAVFNRVAQFEDNTVYADQLCASPSLPLYVAGRLVDSWEYLVRNEGFNKTVAVVSERPWLNGASFGFMVSRGFKPGQVVNSGDVTLRMMSKPYLDVGQQV